MSGTVSATHRSPTPAEIQELAFNAQLGTGKPANDGSEKRRIDLAGPSAQEVLTIERGRSTAGRQDLGTHVGVEASKLRMEAAAESHKLAGTALRTLGEPAALAASRAVEVIAGASTVVGLFEFYAQMVEHTVAAKEAGENLNDAMVRDAVTMSVLLDASALLPSGYLGARQKDLQPARRALDALRLGTQGGLPAEQRAGLRVVVKERFKEGMTTALTGSLTSPDQLRQRVASDAVFGEQYRADVAFREGVNAAVWLGQARPREFEARRRLAGESAAPTAPQTAGTGSVRPALTEPYKQGAEWGLGLDLGSRPKLDAALGRDASFKDRYQKDSEFRRGVDFVVLVGEKRPDEFRRMQHLAERRVPSRVSQ